jgi:DNA-binding XRE family transcriptional regulator
MIGDRIRYLREERGWTQAHLSEASGVSERTIQRVESRHSYSGETAMALAAALGVEVRSLTAPDSTAPGEHCPLWPAPAPLTAASVAVALTGPGAIILVANTLAVTNVTRVPMSVLKDFGHMLRVIPTFWYLWPVPLIAAPLFGILLIVASLIRVHGRAEGSTITITGVEMAWHPAAAAALLLCAATMFAPTANMVGEMIGQAARAPLD